MKRNRAVANPKSRPKTNWTINQIDMDVKKRCTAFKELHGGTTAHHVERAIKQYLASFLAEAAELNHLSKGA